LVFLNGSSPWEQDMGLNDFDHNLYLLIEGGKYVIIIINYVNDLLLTKDHLAKLVCIGKQLGTIMFEMSKLN
jgi:hypothetical protein